MLEVLVIRPGSTTFDEVGRIKGSLDIPLSPQGIEQAERLSVMLQTIKMDCLLVAPCASAQSTAEAIGERNFCKQKTMDWLANLNHGLWQGKSLAEVKRLQPSFYRDFQEDPAHVCPPGGETVQEAIDRIFVPLQKLLRKYDGGRIGILVPEPLASIVQFCLSGGQFGDIWKSESDSGCFQMLRVQSTENYPVLEIA
jgi:probable phosphoglycerate mutase